LWVTRAACQSLRQPTRLRNNSGLRIDVLNSSFARACASYFFFFVERDGITLATALATPDAIFATTPFFGFRFVFEAAGRLLLFVAGLDFDFAFVLVFVPFFTIADCSTPRFVS